MPPCARLWRHAGIIELIRSGCRWLGVSKRRSRCRDIWRLAQGFAAAYVLAQLGQCKRRLHRLDICCPVILVRVCFLPSSMPCCDLPHYFRRSSWATAASAWPDFRFPVVCLLSRVALVTCFHVSMFTFLLLLACTTCLPRRHVLHDTTTHLDILFFCLPLV